MQLSIRLAAVADLAKDAVRLADIGTDHGYVPIYLALQGRLRHAIAMDINRGPLLRAETHIAEYHLGDTIEVRLSDGARELKSGEADTVVIAGMGGPLTIRILTEGEANLAAVQTFILQPQSEIEEVRRFLHRKGFSIEKENMVKDEGKYYPMMRAVRKKQEPWQDFEYRYGKKLIEQKNACLAEFLEREERLCRQILESLSGKSGEHIQNRVRELQKDLQLIQQTRRMLL